MRQSKPLFSRSCCGGPLLFLTTSLLVVGAVFVLLSAWGPGGVFLSVGIGGLAVCVWLGRRHCAGLVGHAAGPQSGG